MDDFALTASSDSYRRNLQWLQRQYALLKAKGSRLGVGFAIPKTELMHWKTNRDRDLPSLAPIYLDRAVFHFRNELRWLGCWFAQSLATTQHFTKRLAKGQAAFVAVKMLFPPGMGLPPFLCHRCVASLLFPILSYRGDVFSPTVYMARKLAVFWHKGHRWCTNCFTCTPTDILAIEACHPRFNLVLSYKKRLANLPVFCSPSEINPAAARLDPSVPTPSLSRHAPDHPLLQGGNVGSRLRLPWHHCRPHSINRAHLPLDAMHQSMMFLMGADGLSPLPVTSQPILAEMYPDHPVGRFYPQERQRCRDLLMQECEALVPDPARYPYRPSLKPHAFMGLNKLNGGRIPQMRSGKSYLRAHPSWDNNDPTTCSKCHESPETFQHATLTYPVRGPARTRHPNCVSDLAPATSILLSAALLGALCRFIRSTRTAFPPGMLSRPTSSPSSASSCSFNVVSFGYGISSQEG